MDPIEVVSRRHALLVAAFASTWALGARAGLPRRVGCLLTGKRPDSWESDRIGYGGLLEGFRALGYVQGRDMRVEWRFAESRLERLPALAAELVRLPVEVIVAGGSPAVSAARQVTRTIPIVMTTVADPLGSGFIDSFARPGGNVTGMSNMAADVGGKYLQFIQSVPPPARRVAVLVVPGNPSHKGIFAAVRSAAQRERIELVAFEVSRARDLPDVMTQLVNAGLRKLIVLPDALFTQSAHVIAQLSEQHRVETIAGFSGYAESGGLMQYSADWFEIYRGAAWYVDKLLRGAPAAELPVRQPSAFHLALNRRAAQNLGIELPASLLAFASVVF